MPPKNKKKAGKGKGKGKPSAMVAGMSIGEMNEDQLWELCVQLQDELEREHEVKRNFQLERDKIQAFFEISKRSLEEAEAELRKRKTEKEEADECHRVELSVNKQKLRHLLSEQHIAVKELKIDTILSTSLLQKQNTESEIALRRDVQNLQMDLQQKDFQNVCSIKERKLKHQMELMEMTDHYERRLREHDVKYHKKMQSVIEAEEEKRKKAVEDLDKRMNSRMESLMEEHEKVVQEADETYASTQQKLQETLMKQEKEQKELQRQEEQESKALAAAQREKQRLTEELHELQQKLPELQRKMQEYHQNKDNMVKSHARSKGVEKELNDLTVKHELLLQAYQKVQQEQDGLRRQQMESAQDLQQRSGLRRMLLERKVAALTDTLEKEEAQLCAALSVSSIDPTERSSATNKLEEILESKRVAMETLQEALDRDCKEYDGLLNSCRPSLQTPDFPFTPARQILKAAAPKR